MQLLLSFIIGTAVGIGMTIPMGPISMYVAQRILNHESRKAAYVALGSVIIDTGYCLIITLGFISLIHPYLQQGYVQFGLSVFLIVYGVKMLFIDQKKVPAAMNGQKDQLGRHHVSIMIGAIMAAANPTLFFSWIAVIGFISAHGLLFDHALDKIVFSFSAGFGSLLWFIGLMFFVRSRRHAISPRFIRRAGLVTALVVMGFGVYFTCQILLRNNVF
jgi:L-lysine exporter family protein LysE/ArgO